MYSLILGTQQSEQGEEKKSYSTRPGQIPAGLLHVAKRVQAQHGVQKSIQIKMSITFCHQVSLAMETAEVEKGVFGLW